jgi:predicted ATP-grasp superfamily ATP-dependent carboligase
VFLKPTDSQGFLREFRVKAFKVDTVDEARARYREAALAGLGLLLQEYIPGPPDRHYFIDGFVDRSHHIVGAFARRRLRMHPADFGNSSCLVSLPLEAVADALSSLRSLFSHARYRGVFSAEFKRDDRDGVFKLIEVNCRPWWYVEFAASCGVNVVDFAYRDALGLALPREPLVYRTGVGLVHTYYDYYACRRMRRRGELSLRSWARSWLTSQRAVFRLDDPAPALSKMSSRVRGRLAGAGG